MDGLYPLHALHREKYLFKIPDARKCGRIHRIFRILAAPGDDDRDSASALWPRSAPVQRGRRHLAPAWRGDLVMLLRCQSVNDGLRTLRAHKAYRQGRWRFISGTVGINGTCGSECLSGIGTGFTAFGAPGLTMARQNLQSKR